MPSVWCVYCLLPRGVGRWRLWRDHHMAAVSSTSHPARGCTVQVPRRRCKPARLLDESFMGSTLKLCRYCCSCQTSDLFPLFPHTGSFLSPCYRLVVTDPHIVPTLTRDCHSGWLLCPVHLSCPVDHVVAFGKTRMFWAHLIMLLCPGSTPAFSQGSPSPSSVNLGADRRRSWPWGAAPDPSSHFLCLSVRCQSTTTRFVLISSLPLSVILSPTTVRSPASSVLVTYLLSCTVCGQ